MFKWILFTLLSLNLFALEVSLSGAKEDFQKYSTLHLKDSNEFLCQEIKDDFDVVTKIVCAFAERPDEKFKTLQNNFFKIETQIKDKTFFLVITPFYKLKLYPMIFDLTKDKSVYQPDIKMSKHWMIIGYDKKLPFLKEEKEVDTAINFPYYSSFDMLPYVGGLDIKGNPVHIKKVKDVSDYLKIKQLYKDGKYPECLDLIKDVEKEYPNSLFNAELTFYKIRLYEKLNDNDNIIAAAKVYLREYSADENVPEVLSLIAKAYSQIGMSTDADYFFDRLFSEHENSPYAKWGYIYKGQMLEGSGASSKAVFYYKKALMETLDIDIAVTAAYRLAQFYIMDSKKEEAAKYITKIVNAKPSFFIKDLVTSMDMMYSFADSEDYLSAAKIAKALLDEMRKNHDEYERLLKDRGIWLSKTSEKKEALDALNRYLSEFPEGMFDNEVQVAKDGLFFDTTDSNATARLSQYDELIKTYAGDTIGDKAIYEKAKLLLQEKRYKEVLDMKDSILGLDSEIYKDTQRIIKDAAIGVMKVSLKDKECHDVLTMSADYNITLSHEWDDGIYDCAMKGGDFLLSKQIAGKNLNSKELDQRKKWLYRYIKVDFATGNYSDVIEASKELIQLTKDDKNSEYKDVYRYLFDTYQRLEQTDNMIGMIVKIEEAYGLNYKDIDRYIAMMTIGSNKKDDNMVIKYGTKVYNLQKSSSSYAQSPFLEFTLYQAYINKENYEKALEVIKSLDDVKLSKTNRSRQKYLLGTVYSKLWRDEDAQKAYRESIDADSASAWAKLAQDAKKI